MPILPRKSLSALLICVPSLACAQTLDLPGQVEQPTPAAAVHPTASRPLKIEGGQPDLQSFLDTQSESDRRKMLDKQQRTFQLEIDGRYAKALKAYCDTGYGDDRCFHPEVSKPAPVLAPAPVPSPSGGVPPPPTFPKIRPSGTESRELPTVAQISGFGDELTAVLSFGGGKRLRVVGPGPNGPRSQLPDGESVVSIRPGEVMVSRPGEARPIPLLFQASAAGLGASD